MDKLTTCTLKEMAYMPFEAVFKAIVILIVGLFRMPGAMVRFLLNLPKNIAVAIKELFESIDRDDIIALSLLAQFLIVACIISWLFGISGIVPNLLVSTFMGVIVTAVGEVAAIVLCIWYEEAERRCMERYEKIKQGAQ